MGGGIDGQAFNGGALLGGGTVLSLYFRSFLFEKRIDLFSGDIKNIAFTTVLASIGGGVHCNITCR